MGRREGKSQSLWNDIKFKKKKLNNIEDYNKGKSKKKKVLQIFTLDVKKSYQYVKY